MSPVACAFDLECSQLFGNQRVGLTKWRFGVSTLEPFHPWRSQNEPMQSRDISLLDWLNFFSREKVWSMPMLLLLLCLSPSLLPAELGSAARSALLSLRIGGGDKHARPRQANLHGPLLRLRSTHTRCLSEQLPACLVGIVRLGCAWRAAYSM